MSVKASSGVDPWPPPLRSRQVMDESIAHANKMVWLNSPRLSEAGSQSGLTTFRIRLPCPASNMMSVKASSGVDPWPPPLRSRQVMDESIAHANKMVWLNSPRLSEAKSQSGLTTFRIRFPCPASNMMSVKASSGVDPWPPPLRSRQVMDESIAHANKMVWLNSPRLSEAGSQSGLTTFRIRLPCPASNMMSVKASSQSGSMAPPPPPRNPRIPWVAANAPVLKAKAFAVWSASFMPPSLNSTNTQR